MRFPIASQSPDSAASGASWSQPPKRSASRWRAYALSIGLSLLAGSQGASHGQTPIDNMVFTVGTAARDSLSRDWSYILVGSPQPEILGGKRFAVYSKPGYPTNAGSYAVRGNIFQQTDTAAVNGLLNQSAFLGDDLLSLSNSLNVLLRKLPGVTNQTLAQKVLSGFQAARSDEDLAAMLRLVTRAHPGMAMVAGEAFSEQITTTTTYEVREVDPGTGTAGAVIGRVTVSPNTPIVLPATGAPFQLVGKDANEHLRIRLRWGTPNTLRRLSLLSYGFNLWRISRGEAEAANYHNTPPTTAQLYSDPRFSRVNNAPITTTRDFAATSGPGGADDLADSTTFFYSDDNGARYGWPAFLDGAQYYYYVTARDILGRDGEVSPGGLAQACRRLTPAAPTGLRVENDVQNIVLGGGSATNEQRLVVTWQQSTNAADLVSEYWVYRWPNPSMALTNDAAPLENRVGVAPHILNAELNQFRDTAAGAPMEAGPGTYWYTVRAISQGACDQLLSPHSGPAWGVLRQRAGPEAPTGAVYGSCGTPAIMFKRFNTITNEDWRPTSWSYVFTCQRRDPGIAWAQFFVTNRTASGTSVEPLAPIYFSPEDDTVQAEYSAKVTPDSSPTNDVGCVVGTFYDRVSVPAVARFTVPVGPDQSAEAVFLAGELLETALNANDPLLLALNGSGLNCATAAAVTPDPSGTVALKFSQIPAGIPLAIQALDGNAWQDLGIVFPDANQFYWVSYPACLVGPLVSFRGCQANLPQSSGDCAEHVTRAADDGPVAPIQIQFVPSPRSRTYRIYRSADSGPLTMVAEGRAEYNPLWTTRRIVRRDDAMPPSAARLCYFVQTFDENGNGSPMAFLGCKEVKPAKLPKPVLAEPRAAGAVTNPLVSLNWFCPTAGVHRFQIRIERADKPASGDATGFSSSKLTRALKFNPAALYKGVGKVRFARRASLTRFDEAHDTPPVGPTFGPGPQFTLEVSVVAGVPYNISVAAVDAQGHTGESSPAWRFTWAPPVVLADVPWPARPMPPVRSSFNEGTLLAGYDLAGAAFLVRNANLAVDRRWPVGIAIGDFSSLPRSTTVYLNAGTTQTLSYITSGFSTMSPDNLVFRRTSPNPARRGENLLPMVVYRQQLTNAVFPRVSGKMTQVTPLLEAVQAYLDPFGDIPVWNVTDRLIVGGLVPYGSDSYTTAMLVRDQQPVIKGARYQYFVVRLNDRREVAEVFSAGVVDIPADL